MLVLFIDCWLLACYNLTLTVWFGVCLFVVWLPVVCLLVSCCVFVVVVVGSLSSCIRVAKKRDSLQS